MAPGTDLRVPKIPRHLVIPEDESEDESDPIIGSGGVVLTPEGESSSKAADAQHEQQLAAGVEQETPNEDTTEKFAIEKSAIGQAAAEVHGDGKDLEAKQVAGKGTAESVAVEKEPTLEDSEGADVEEKHRGKKDMIERNDEDNESARKPLIRVHQIFDRREWKYKYARASRSTKKISSKYALVVRKKFDEKGNYEETVVEIRGDGLRERKRPFCFIFHSAEDVFSLCVPVLESLLAGAEGLRLSENPPVIEPRLLYHYKEELRSRLKEEEAGETKHNALIFELKAVLQLIDEDFAEEDANIQCLLAKEEITFETLWAIFPPNTSVYSLDALSEPCAYRSVSCRIKKLDGSLVFQVEARYVTDGGKDVGWAKKVNLEIPFFAGAKEISNLPIHPLDYHPHSERLFSELLERGRRRLEMHKQGFYDYTGHALQEKEDSTKQKYLEKFNNHGRIITDHALFKQINPNSGFVQVIETVIPSEEITDDELITLPSMLFGFSLGDKLWGGFAVSRISDIAWDHSIWDSLVLPSTQKRLIRALIKNHVANSGGFDDFVQDKGKGLVGLLAGPPGVGKTLTAEAVAETVQRPLYSISSGELGDKPHEIDKRLRKILELTQTLNAVLLLDEADVFMTTRKDTDITRNAIVSIFLRQLEYYQGILILTTNRANTIDDAFHSRIHFHFSYKELDAPARKAIWAGLLKRLSQDNNFTVDVDPAGIEDLAKLQTNGRQIKNIIKMAQLISFEENQPLTITGLQEVAKSLQSFTF